MGVAHKCGSTMNCFIMTDIWKVITPTLVQHLMATDVQNSEVQKLIRDYYARMYAAIGTEVVIYPDVRNLLF